MPNVSIASTLVSRLSSDPFLLSDLVLGVATEAPLFRMRRVGLAEAYKPSRKARMISLGLQHSCSTKSALFGCRRKLCIVGKWVVAEAAEPEKQADVIQFASITTRKRLA